MTESSFSGSIKDQSSLLTPPANDIAATSMIYNGDSRIYHPLADTKATASYQHAIKSIIPPLETTTTKKNSSTERYILEDQDEGDQMVLVIK